MVKKYLKERMGSIILFAVLILFVLWGVISINRARQRAITYDTAYEAPEGTRDADTGGSYVSVAKNDKLELLYNDKKGSIQLKNLKNGYVWKSVVDDEVFDLSKVNKTWRVQLTSPISVTYNDLKNKDPKKVSKVFSSDTTKCNYLEYEKIANGVAVTYGFLTPGIYITVEYTLEDGGLKVRIPKGKIVELSRYAVMRIEMLPYFGAAGNEAQGYMFYPDGSGAVTVFENYKMRPSNVKLAYWFGYTPLTFTEASLFNDEEYDRYTMSMPVFGIKNSDNAVFAVFSEGAESGRLVVYPSGESSVDLNRIGFEIYARNIYNVNMSNISTGVDSVVTGDLVQRLDKNIIEEDREIRYFVLDGENANYSGMAGVYRDYLINSGQLTDSVEDGAVMPLALDLLMGATKDGMVFEEYIPMTTFGQAEDILESLKAKGITNTEVVLRSWVTGSENKMNYWGPASKLGGTGGLKKLNNYAAENPGTNLYLETQFTEASDKTKGFNKSDDVAYDGLGSELATEYMNGETRYLLNFNAAAERNEGLLKKLDKYDSLGVAYKWLGKYVYPDSNEKYPFTKAEAVEVLKGMLALADEKNHKVGVQGVNPYTYQSADYFYGLKEGSYGRSISDYSVPFMEMVLSGLKTYSTEGAGNLSYDLDYQMLRWAELGAVPYFSLTYESALNLRETDYDDMFSSTFEDWEDTVVQTYQKYAQDFAPVFGQQMVKHEVLATNVVRVTYANGYQVYINYNDNSVKSGGVTIPGMQYLIVKGGK